MEEHKRRALHTFLKRSADKTLSEYVKLVDGVAEELMECYEALDEERWKKYRDRFVQLMITGACFLHEVVRVGTGCNDGYHPSEPVFSSHGMLFNMPYFRRDILLIENQLPLQLLFKLVAAQTGEEENDDLRIRVNRRILNFFSREMPSHDIVDCLHILDLFRKSMIMEQRRPQCRRSILVENKGVRIPVINTSNIQSAARWFRPSQNYSNFGIIRSATELHEAGVRFKKSKADSLMDITFKDGVLRLPPSSVNDATECTLLNVIALERLHNGTGYQVTSYVFFMDNILDSPKEVNLLRYRGILKRALGSDEALAKLFNRLSSKDIAPDIDPNFPLVVIHQDLSKYCKISWNKWKANLRHNYLFNPWVVSVAASSLLGMSQTAYTILGYHKPPAS
ncbi:hypothetical protein H6P81_013346 [Aristolochia fimbriata]|uniref:Uncharacterized protein n=1 Tax=Aristolochia fimbriata TaxID=158543 RepID=A0AAV7EEF9_ARIFI|nr:hypothetical protein H6P81_013346 [Aristolochia fimbriata]